MKPENEVTPVVETQEEAKPERKIVIDSNKSLNSQVDKFLKAIPEEVKEEEKAEEIEEVKEEVKEEVAKVTETPDEDDDELEEVEYEPPKGLPDWQQYVLEGLPDIQTIGHTEDGKDKVFTVKHLGDLPDDFEFASKRAEMAFNAANSAQEINARELKAKYESEEQKRGVEEFQAREAIDIQRDIKSLQREGILPKFQYAENDPKFNDDPAVKEANEIYKLYQKTNSEHYSKYSNTGTSYRISFVDAADKYYAAKYRNQPKEPVKEVKTKTQEEREKVASKIGATQSAAPEAQFKPIRSGTSPQDIYKLYKAGRI